MSTIPSKVDVIILGTGLTNSIIAAACSRIGKTVLHLDENNYYGNDWASFTFQQLIDWIKIKYPGDKSLENIPDELMNKSRMFCIDLAPRFLFSNGSMVELLVKSNVARYHEFKNNIRILCSIDGNINVMPCRRNEVFTSALLTNLADKRRLMQFIEFCTKFDSDNMLPNDREYYKSISIKRFLEERGLKTTLQEYIINSIAMVHPMETTINACDNIKKFMIATERYGRSPFLFPLYGCGEFPQSFCRLSAVFGGLYCLNTKIKEVKVLQSVDKAQSESGGEKFSVKFSDDNHTVASDMLVIEQARAIDLKLIDADNIHREYLSRAILLTRDSIVPTEDSDNPSKQDMASFLRIPPKGTDDNTVFLIELNSSVLVCPKDMHIVYLWTLSTGRSGNPEDDLKSTVEELFEDNMDCIVWKFYYRQLVRPDFIRDYTLAQDQTLEPGTFMTKPICDDVDYDSNTSEAELVFKRMYPDQEFLPRAPDPDEIIST